MRVCLGHCRHTHRHPPCSARASSMPWSNGRAQAGRPQGLASACPACACLATQSFAHHAPTHPPTLPPTGAGCAQGQHGPAHPPGVRAAQRGPGAAGGRAAAGGGGGQGGGRGVAIGAARSAEWCAPRRNLARLESDVGGLWGRPVRGVPVWLRAQHHPHAIPCVAFCLERERERPTDPTELMVPIL